MEKMEVTQLPSDNSNIECLEDLNNSDSNLLTEQDVKEIQRSNSDSSGTGSLQPTEIDGSNVSGETAIKVTEHSDIVNINSVSQCAAESTDSKSTSNKAFIWETIRQINTMNSSEDGVTEDNRHRSEDNDENCNSITLCLPHTSASDSLGALPLQCGVENSSKIRSEGNVNFEESVLSNKNKSQQGVANDGDQIRETNKKRDNALKISPQEQGNKSVKDDVEKEYTRTSILNKSCLVNSNILHVDLKQQSSEIKDRVMSFLTKYSSVEDTSTEGNHCETFSEDKCSKEKKHDCSENNNNNKTLLASDVFKDSKIKRSDCELSENSALSSLINKELHVPNTSQNHRSLELSAKISSSVSVESSVHENCQCVTGSSCTSESPSQINKYVLSTPNNEKCVSSCFQTAVSTYNGNGSLVANNDSNTETDMECCLVECVSKTNKDTLLFQQKDENMINDLSSKGLYSLHPFNSSACSWDSNAQGQCSMPQKEVYEQKQQSDMEGSISSSDKELNFNRPFAGNQMSSASSIKNTLFTYNPNISLKNQSSHSLFEDNIDFVPDCAMYSTWGRISFQPLITPAINRPIFSCISSNEQANAKQASSFTACQPVSNTLVGNLNGSSHLPSPWSPKNCSISRRTKSSEANFLNMSFPLSSEGATSVNNASSKSKTFDTPSIGKTVVNTRSEFSTLDFGKCRLISTEINANDSGSGIFGSNSGKITNVFGKVSNPSSSDVCFGSLLANGPGKGNSDNPFSKKSPVESIGLFRTSLLKPVGEIGNSVFKSVLSSTSFPAKRERIEEIEGAESGTQDYSVLKQGISKDNCLFPSLLSSDKQRVEAINASTAFSFSNAFSYPKSDAKFMFGSEPTSEESTNRQSPFLCSETCAPQINSNSAPFQFTFNAEKTKTCFTNRATLTRQARKLVKTYKHDKSLSKCVRETSSFINSAVKGTGYVAFKPVYGSDVRMDHGSYKNVFVRYQNIAFMDEYNNISPEELQYQYYAKTRVSGPFKFTSSSDTNEMRNDKKTQNQETQTDKQLTPKMSELAGIWRALECPVCFDVVLSPVYQCEQGHHVCSSCWNKVVTCPLCKRHKSGTRNYMAEALVEQVPLPCKYHIEGCKETVQHINKVNHEETCTYRMYECPVPLCNQAHSYQNMCKHFKKAHKRLLHHEGHSVGKGEKFCDVLYKEALSLFLVHAFDITKWGLFFLRKVTVHNSSALFIQIMPAVADQAVYFYHLEVSDHHDCRKECYKGRVFSMGKPTHEIVDQEEYLCLSDLILKTVNKNTPLKIVVTIWQLKPAFTLSTE